MILRRLAVPTALAAASALVLAGCATPAGAGEGGDGADEGRITVVASTNVYGQIAEAIGGDLVDVTSIVSSASQDPHSFEPSARDQLSVSRADLIIENGGGYDAFIDALIESSGSSAPVITAAEFSHDWPENGGHEEHGESAEPEATEAATEDAHAEDEHDHEHTEEAHADHEHTEEAHAEDDGHDHDHDHDHDHGDHGHVEGFNEHVWYDPHTIAHVAEAIVEELSELAPDEAETFTANAEAFSGEIETIEGELAAIEAAHAGTEIFVTEPVPLYLSNAAGLVNVAPEAFTEAVEEGQDVPPATLLEALDLLRAGTVKLVVTNAQTGGAETTAVLDEAETAGITIIEFTETLPEGQTYISWMTSNVDALAGALAT